MMMSVCRAVVRSLFFHILKKEKQQRKWPLFCFWGVAVPFLVGQGWGLVVGLFYGTAHHINICVHVH